MTRGAFNTTVQVEYGPSGLIPGLVYANVPARVVLEKFEFPLLYPFSQRIAYITMDAIVPNQALQTGSGSVVNLDFAAADILTDAAGQVFVVLAVERVQPKMEPVYVRAWVSPWPLPAAWVSADGQWRVAKALWTAFATVTHDFALGRFVASKADFQGYAVNVLPPYGAFRSKPATFFASTLDYRIYDDFTVADQTNQGRTPTIIDVPGSTWVNDIGTVSVVSHVLEATSFASFAARSLIDNGQRCKYISVDVVLPSSSIRNIVVIPFRFVDGSNFWYAQIEYTIGNPFAQNDTLFLEEVTAGSTFLRASVGLTLLPLVTHTIVITDDGTNIDASILGAHASHSSTGENSGTKTGCYPVSFDNGAAGPITFAQFKVK